MQRGQLLWQKQDSRCVLNKSMNILANDRKGDTERGPRKVSEDSNLYENLQFELEFLN